MIFHLILQFNTRKGIVCMRGHTDYDPTETPIEEQRLFLARAIETLHIPPGEIVLGDDAGMISVFTNEETCTSTYKKLLENTNAKTGTFPEYAPS